MGCKQVLAIVATLFFFAFNKNLFFADQNHITLTPQTWIPVCPSEQNFGS